MGVFLPPGDVLPLQIAARIEATSFSASIIVLPYPTYLALWASLPATIGFFSFRATCAAFLLAEPVI
jgi:hypothetical protein